MEAKRRREYLYNYGQCDYREMPTLLTIGDEGVGKCYLQKSCINQHLYDLMADGLCRNPRYYKEQDDRLLFISLAGYYDVPNHEGFRKWAYPHADVLFLCFSVSSRSSFNNISKKWLPEAKLHCPKIPWLLIGCKSDLRSSLDEDCVPEREARELATRLGSVAYIETSMLQLRNIPLCLDVALYVGVVSKRNKGELYSGGYDLDRIILPPIIPPAAPEITVANSVFSDQWLRVLKDSMATDVSLELKDGRLIHCHKILLVSSPKVLRKRFFHKPSIMNRLSGLYHGRKLQPIKGIQSIERDGNKFVIKLDESMDALTSEYLLEFLYSGTIEYSSRLTNDIMAKLKEISSSWSLPYLADVCNNVQNGAESLNSEIRNCWKDEIGKAMKSIFLDKKAFSDVKFIFKDKVIFAHKCVLVARNEIMATMFSEGKFKEGKMSGKFHEVDMTPNEDADVFHALLEYLYTDQCPIDSSIVFDLLSWADRYDITRLVNLCEVYISTFIDKICTKKKGRAAMDAIGILNFARVHNAHQLVKWTLHYISINYIALSQSTGWKDLPIDDQKLIEEHRWPPVDDLDKMADYEAFLKTFNEKNIFVK